MATKEKSKTATQPTTSKGAQQNNSKQASNKKTPKSRYFYGQIQDNDVEKQSGSARDVSRATIERTVEFQSLQAQRVIDRSFMRLKGSFYSISVVLHILTDSDETVQEIDDYIDEKFIEIEQDLIDEQSRIKVILENDGIDTDVKYSNPRKYKLLIDSPRANNFLRLVSQLDKLMLLMDSAWIFNGISDVQKKQESYKWQRRLMKFAAQIINLEIRARDAATKKGKEQEVNEHAPVDTSEQHPELVEAGKESELIKSPVIG
ncbi:MAG: hypothetical protein HOM14_03845 [Gammaproteobacteria bacterium]|jgi:hypothetical protein|nr:hypothetical protein [Gammaproteobacteria bacterium]MBT4194801.1 hypothetical protein [Gammaproteobacteria bacterium]MBT6454217.1 hypothetical protein [Gammaproteobacteria bacterium]MBT6550468.1 hypothetical protein [Gammaproteobacteria bacterium]MBT6701418.1 hypothetical protein [Gammaproteobacteria bacterium]